MGGLVQFKKTNGQTPATAASHPFAPVAGMMAKAFIQAVTAKKRRLASEQGTSGINI